MQDGESGEVHSPQEGLRQTVQALREQAEAIMRQITTLEEQVSKLEVSQIPQPAAARPLEAKTVEGWESNLESAVTEFGEPKQNSAEQKACEKGRAILSLWKDIKEIFPSNTENLSQEQLDWLQNNLANLDSLIYLFNSYPSELSFHRYSVHERRILRALVRQIEDAQETVIDYLKEAINFEKMVFGVRQHADNNLVDVIRHVPASGAEWDGLIFQVINNGFTLNGKVYRKAGVNVYEDKGRVT